MCGDAVGPEDEGRNCWPSRGVAIAGFDEGVADSSVLSLDDAICPRVVGRNVDMPDAIPV